MEKVEEPTPKKMKLDEENSAVTSPKKQLTSEEGPLSQDDEPAQGQSSTVSKLKEEDVGITEYVGFHEGFFGILKQRYSDFHVHELDMSGHQVQLTSFDIPVESTNQGVQSVLEDVLSSEDVARLKTLAESSSSDNSDVRIQASEDKQKRTLVHRAVKEHFPHLSSKTEEQDGEKFIVISHGKNEGRSKWPSNRGKYCKFALYKENTDTSAAIGTLSKILRVKASHFQYAGMKDHRAITTQWVTAFKTSAEKLNGVNKTCKNIKIGNFEYVSDPLKLGSLSGNHFTIILRKVSCENHVIDDAMSSLSDVGFINYFGMQRFGTTTIPTQHVGRCLLLSDWQGAIDLILKPRPGESEDVSEAREYYSTTKDASGTLAKLPRRGHHIERQLLQGLEKHGEKNNLLGALSFITRNSRLMYVHSWQSYIWNKMVAWRIKQCGLQPVVGDLVVKCRVNEGEGERQREKEVEYITEENLSQYSIHDVVLPLPGFDVKLPANQSVLDYLLQLLKEDGLSIEQLKHRVPDFALPGTYRNIVVKPGSLKWETLHYDDVTIPLVPTDLDIVAGKTAIQSLQDGKYKALNLDFTLPPATYATMLIRELLRLDTSAAYQTTLNHDKNSSELS